MTKFFDEAELAKMPLIERKQYEYNLKVYRDMENVKDYAKKIGKEEGYISYDKVL